MNSFFCYHCEREQAALVDETSSKNYITEENPFSDEANTTQESQSDLDHDKQPKKSSNSNSKEDVTNPLKKEEMEYINTTE